MANPPNHAGPGAGKLSTPLWTVAEGKPTPPAPGQASPHFYALKLLRTGRSSYVLARWMLALFLLGIVALFLPWQQNIRANGRVTAFAPNERPQEVNTVIPGRIEQWFVQEGMFVEVGDTLLILGEVKDKYLDPKTAERTLQQVEANRALAINLMAKATALRDQIQALEQNRTLSIEKAENKVEQAQMLVRIDSAALEAAQVDQQVAKVRLERQQVLYDSGLVSQTDLESRQLKLQETQAKLAGAQNKLMKARTDLINARIERNSVEAEYREKLAKAESDLRSTLAYIDEVDAKVAKLTNEYDNIRVRSGYYVVRAPQTGFVVQALKQGIGEMVKEGEAVVTIMPRSPQMAVELYVRPTDVPLITPGKTPVRLEFDGWPALQFSGWPSVSVGTFGGVVQVVDYTTSKNGKYRVLVVPDPKPGEDPWPQQLRMGSGVHGWAMLNEVTVGFEIWRQLNGFPPALEDKPADYDIYPDKYAPGQTGTGAK